MGATHLSAMQLKRFQAVSLFLAEIVSTHLILIISPDWDLYVFFKKRKNNLKIRQKKLKKKCDPY